jgi:hypothetical protein
MAVLSEEKGSCNALYGGKEFLMTVLGRMEGGRYSGRVNARLWIEEANDLVAIETEISLNWKGLVAIEIATAVREKSLAVVATEIFLFSGHEPIYFIEK